MQSLQALNHVFVLLLQSCRDVLDLRAKSCIRPQWPECVHSCSLCKAEQWQVPTSLKTALASFNSLLDVLDSRWKHLRGCLPSPRAWCFHSFVSRPDRALPAVCINYPSTSIKRCFRGLHAVRGFGLLMQALAHLEQILCLVRRLGD